jgi:ATP adenylyltransferase
MSAQNPITPGTLTRRIQQRSEQALRSGAQQPIATESSLIHDSGVDFLVRAVSSLARKEQARLERAARIDVDPFLPCDPELCVGDLSETHVAVLNKYNVIPRHLLLVTRDFEHQELLLTRADLEAAWLCLQELDGLVFYNGGTEAGASQPHKHLQLVPLPLGDSEDAALPSEPLLETAEWRGGLGRTDRLPFVHAVAHTEAIDPVDLSRAAEQTLTLFAAMLQQVGLGAYRPGARQAGPYNLLLTRRWMLLVPRSREHVPSTRISINALGYAGSLFVRDQEQLRALHEIGPMTALSRVSAMEEP